jgi:Spy/CpxP family protein refolding chaperone
MYRRNRNFFLGALGLALATTALGCSHGGWRHGDEGEPAAVARHLDKVFDHLDVTAEQRTQLEPVALAMANEIASLRQRALGLRADALAQWEAATPDAAELHQRVDQDIEALRQSLHRFVDQAIAVHDTLTPEQREEVASHAGRHRHGRGRF